MPARGGDGEPIQGFRFLVLISGQQGKTGFQTVSGLSEESEEANYREGTDALTQHKYPGLVTYSDVELSDGVSSNLDLVNWRRRVVQIQNSGAANTASSLEGVAGVNTGLFRATVRIQLFDQLGTLRKEWKLLDAWPKALNYDDLDATSSDILMRTLVIAHEGLIVSNTASTA